jgi:hypothetical protein
MIKPNLIFSHDWHVQPNCQRSLRDIHLSGALWDRGSALRLSCPRTRCACQCALNNTLWLFCGNLPNISEFVHPVKLNLFRLPRPTQHAVGGNSSLANLDQLDWNQIQFKKLRSAKISNNDQQTSPEPLRLTGVSSWVLQSLVLCGIPYRGFRG